MEGGRGGVVNGMVVVCCLHRNNYRILAGSKFPAICVNTETLLKS